MTVEKPWALPSQEVILALKSDPVFGLSQDEAKRRLKKLGLNEIASKKPSSLMAIILRQASNALIYLLLLTIIISLLSGEWRDALAILMVIAINLAIGSYQEYKAQKTINRLRHILTLKASVIREGVAQAIDARQLVVGDIIKVEAGNIVPADSRLIKSQYLKINEANLTGESSPDEKSEHLVSKEAQLGDRDNMIYASTSVVGGEGLAVVTATGKNSELGKIAEQAAALEDESTNLQEKLSLFSKLVAVSALAIGALTIALAWARQIEWSELIKTAIALMVSIVPEGLPIALTVVMAVSLMRVYRSGAIIRRLQAAETIGATTVMVIDKTGTITEGKMMVSRLITGSEEIEITGSDYQLDGHFLKAGRRVDIHKHPQARLMLELISLAANANITQKDIERGQVKTIGDPTETALAVAAAKANFFGFREEKYQPVVLDQPFTSEERCSVSVHRLARANRYVVKGAPEEVLSRSRYYLNNQACKRRFSPATQSEIEELAHKYSLEGYRIIALAYLDRSIREPINVQKARDLIFVGYFCLNDPIREEAAEMIQTAQAAGIRVIISTGDHLLTSQAIAREVGLDNFGQVGSVQDFIKDMNGEKINVLSRCLPKDKLQIVTSLQRRGHIVAMTGDGINDAVALKKADVGIALGRGGCDVAIESADIVLLRNNIGTIIAAIRQGRLIWENLKKIVFYLSTTSLDETFLVFFSLAIGVPLPIVAVQILWLNLVTDGITTMSLTNEKEEDDSLMKKPPRHPREFIFTGKMVRRILFISALIAAGSYFVFRLSLPLGIEYARTAALTTMIFFQLSNLLNSRSMTKSVFELSYRNNLLIPITIAISLIIHFAFVYSPLGKIVHFTPLNWQTLALALTVGLTVIAVEEIRKLRRGIVEINDEITLEKLSKRV